MTDEQNEASMRITLRDVYREQQEMKSLLSTIASSIPSMSERMNDHYVRSQQKFDDHERRIRLVESRIWKAIGGFGLFAAAMPFLAKLI
jgi:hypothetical protein